MRAKPQPYVSTTNACKLCKPLGACLAFRGMEGAVPFLHGSQGCATYMRRYVISHFREPMDIASSSLGEKHAVYGGGPNLKLGLKNVMAKYQPGLIGIATTCLTETIGDDVPMLVKEFVRDFPEVIQEHGSPALVSVSTPSYSGTHMEGFHAAVAAAVAQLAAQGLPHDGIALFPGFVSPADTRYLKEILADFELQATVLPDISLTLDAPALVEYETLPSGGTPIPAIRALGGSRAAIEFGRTLEGQSSAGKVLHDRFSTPLHALGMPIGLRETDAFFSVLEALSGRGTPVNHELERGRLIDAYVDGHKYLFGARAVVYGEEDLVTGLTAFLAEIGVRPVLCASGGRSGRLAEAIRDVTQDLLPEPPLVREGVDFYDIAEEAEALEPEILIGNSKGYHLARKWGVPIIRVGFPIHDRFGGHRTLHLGYRGAQSLLDRIVNARLEAKQEASPVGYSYI
ncbi:MAG: nitrogenase [Desulfomonile tiedjei]|nr:nitrogenase [Desulfomonile tiedjei]